MPTVRTPKPNIGSIIKQQREEMGFPPLMEEEADLKAGAQNLAWMVRDYWKDRGYHGIRAWPERSGLFSRVGRELWTVKSNIGPTGYPPRESVKVAA